MLQLATALNLAATAANMACGIYWFRGGWRARRELTEFFTRLNSG